jgi:hypothetical protein
MKTTGTNITGIARVASIGAIASVITLTSAAASQPHQNYNINRRTQNQQSHLQQGIQSGSLTRNEVSRLTNKSNNMQSKLQTMRANNNGHLSSAQRQQVLHAQNRLARDIYRLKHDQDHHPALATAPGRNGRTPHRLAHSPGPLQ